MPVRDGSVSENMITNIIVLLETLFLHGSSRGVGEYCSIRKEIILYLELFNFRLLLELERAMWANGHDPPPVAIGTNKSLDLDNLILEYDVRLRPDFGGTH